MFGDWKRGEYVVLKAFKDYVSPPGENRTAIGARRNRWSTRSSSWWCPTPPPSRAGLLSGAIDDGSYPTTDVPELKSQKQVRIQVASDAAKHTLLFQTRDPLLKNVKLRQAIAASLDIPQIVQAATKAWARPAHRPSP